MPGPMSDQYKGTKGHMPVVPTWMEEGTKEHSAWLQDVCCPICDLLLDGGRCHECGYTGEKGDK
jgi:hypothetical protein